MYPNWLDSQALMDIARSAAAFGASSATSSIYL